MRDGNAAAAEAAQASGTVGFETAPERYRHWRLAIDGAVATLTLDVDESAGLEPGYALKRNSYDLGVDIELADAVQRLRFEHPEVGAVVLALGPARRHTGLVLTFAGGAVIWAASLAGWLEPLPENMTSAAGSLVLAGAMVQSARVCKAGDCSVCADEEH